MSHNIWDLVLSEALSLNSAKLETAFLGIDLVRHEPSFDVIHDSVVLVGLLNGYNVHNSERELGVSPYLVVNFDQSFLVFNDLSNFIVRQSILQSLSQKDGHRQALLSLMGTSRGLDSVLSGTLVQEPGMRGCDSLLMLLLSFSSLETIGK